MCVIKGCILQLLSKSDNFLNACAEIFPKAQGSNFRFVYVNEKHKILRKSWKQTMSGIFHYAINNGNVNQLVSWFCQLTYTYGFA